ncbi:hypothetical protein DPMN_105731 [Dreissena polymorpha]|uniref:Uncharacterized protein n=1 Tax=Dreissena polymorpha TaxID=45954 RepID=A0A9D4K3S6_DREPO|nr:hypothetical protein DPMN_105731 [Dreissena polymorpha]
MDVSMGLRQESLQNQTFPYPLKPIEMKLSPPREIQVVRVTGWASMGTSTAMSICEIMIYRQAGNLNADC